MGKGSRNRQVRTEDKIANPQNYVKKKSAPKHLYSILTLILVVVIVGAIVFTSLTNSGTILRMQDAIQSENFEVTGTMMSYYAHTIYSSYLNSYSSTYSSYLDSAGYTVYDLLGIDPNTSLKKQVMNKETGETWYAYFMSQARDQAEEILLYCEGAKVAGIELDDADYEEIETSLAMLSYYARAYGYSYNSYLANLYGTGVREKDVRRAMELSALASKYVEKLAEDYYAAAGESDVIAFFEENSTDYLSADYLAFELTATKGTLSDNATEEETAAVEANYAAAKDLANTTADLLKAATDEETFRQIISDYITETNLDSYMDKHYDTYLQSAEGETDEEKAAAAEQMVKDKLNEYITTQLENLLVEDAAYANSTDVDKWMFGEEGANPAAANTTYADVDDSKDEDGTYTVKVYFMIRSSSRDEALTYDAAYLALSSTSYTQEDADAALAAFEETAKDKDALLALADTYPSHSGCTEIENMRPGYFGMDTVDEWTFSTDRKAGDYQLLSYTDNSTTYYILVYIIGEGDQVWYAECLDDLVTKQTEQWLEDAQKTCPIEVNEKTLNNINM